MEQPTVQADAGGPPPESPPDVPPQLSPEQAPAPRELTVDDEGRLAEDVQCRHCGYNLRGLAMHGRCPECETSIGRSVHGDLLRFCDPGWVGTLAAGMRLYVISIIAGIVFGLTFGIGVGVSVVMTGTLAAPLVVVMILLSAALTVVQLLAYWKITAPDPGRDESEKPLTLRAVARYALIGSTVLGIIAALADASRLGTYAILASTAPAAVVLMLTITVAAAALGVVGTIALCLYGISLADRLPDAQLARSTRTVMWGTVICGGSLQLANVGHEIIVAAGAGSQVLEIVSGLAMLVAVLPGLVFWIWGIVLLFMYRNRMIATAGQARATWAREV